MTKGDVLKVAVVLEIEGLEAMADKLELVSGHVCAIARILCALDGGADDREGLEVSPVEGGLCRLSA